MFGLTLEKWSYLATAISAFTAVIFVAFGAYQLFKLRKQVILTGDSVDAAKRAANAAQEAARETARVRIDEQAPRVIALMESPQWPPRVSSGRANMPYANELRLLDPQSVQSAVTTGAEEYIFPGQEQWLLWFIDRGVLINEGDSTARVRLDGEARFVDGESPLVPDEKIPYPPPVGAFHGPDYISREHLLRPGKVALFEWAYGHQLKEWADKRDQGTPPICTLTIAVFDSTEYGVVDHIKVELGARPLEPVAGKQAHWRLVSNPRAGVTVWPTTREYRSEKEPEPRV